MTATRDNLIQEARNIRHSLDGLSPSEVADAIREVLRYYAPKSCPDYLENIILEAMADTVETG